MEKRFDIVKINETITDLIDDHILVCDTEGQIVFSNMAIQSYLSYDRLELERKKFFRYHC